MDELLRKKLAEDSLKQEYEQTLTARINRYLQVKPHEIIPYTHFAVPAAECCLQFRDGHYYGCIALTQAVAEALIRFICQKNLCDKHKKFEKNIEKLLLRNFISGELKDLFLKIWEDRNNYHHLNPQIQTERQKLEDLAREKIQFLEEALKNVFRFTVIDGKLIPQEPKYWDIRDGKAEVFLRLDP